MNNGNVIVFKPGYKFQLKSDYRIQLPFKNYSSVTDFLALTIDGFLTISKGYAWNGVTGPFPNIDKVMRATLVHDSLCQLIRLGVIDIKDRKQCDMVFLNICKEDGLPPFIA